MKNIIYRLGNLFDSDERCLVHGCNSMGAYGSGVASLMRARHPAAYTAYRDAFEVSGLRVGEVIWAESKNLLIGNAITQERYGANKSVVYTDYDGVRAAMQQVNQRVSGKYQTVGMPQIGAGLGNGDWQVIAKIIEEEARDFTPVVYILDHRLYDAATVC